MLAGDIGVGPPGEEDESETRFAVTAEAGLNDGLAFPFVVLALFVSGRPGAGWLPEWNSDRVTPRGRRDRRIAVLGSRRCACRCPV